MAEPPPVFKDQRITVHAFAEDVLVCCPDCGSCARVFKLDARRWRMSCLECGRHREQTDVRQRSHYSGASGTVRDPVFGIDVWLQAGCCGGNLLWAYNLEHLAFLGDFVTAKIRQRPDAVAAGEWDRRMTMVAKLPAWLKAAKHRDEILRAIGRLRATVPDR